MQLSWLSASVRWRTPFPISPNLHSEVQPSVLVSTPLRDMMSPLLATSQSSLDYLSSRRRISLKHLLPTMLS